MPRSKLKKSSHSNNSSYRYYYGGMSLMLWLLSLGIIWGRFHKTNSSNQQAVVMLPHNNPHSSYPIQLPSLMPLVLSAALAHQLDNPVLGLLSSWPFLFATPAVAQTSLLYTVIPEFQVNDNTTDSQERPAITRLPSGEWVVVWSGRQGSNYDIYAQRYTGSGTPLGTQFRLNSVTVADQYNPAITSLPSSEWVVAWYGHQSGSTDIYAQRYNRSGTPLGTEFQVNNVNLRDQINPALTSLPSGEWVVAWQDNREGLASNIYAQRYAGNGTPIDTEFRVNTVTTRDQIYPALTSLPSGEWVVVWSGSQSSSYDIYAQRYAGSGTPIGTEFRLSNITTGNGGPVIASSPLKGGWIVVWTSSNQTIATDIYARRYTDSGIPLGPEFRVNNVTMGSQDSPAIAVLPSGEWIVVWSGNQDGNSDIYAQRFTSNDIPLGPEFRINNVTIGNQYSPAISSLSSEEWVVLWRGFQTASFKIYATIFSSSNSSLITPFMSTTTSQTVVTVPTTSSVTASAMTGSTQSSKTSTLVSTQSGSGLQMTPTLAPTSSNTQLRATSDTSTLIETGNSRTSLSASESNPTTLTSPSTNFVPIITAVGGFGLAACLATVGFYLYRKKSRANNISQVTEKKTETSLRDRQGATAESSNYARIDEIKMPEKEYDAPKILGI